MKIYLKDGMIRVSICWNQLLSLPLDRYGNIDIRRYKNELLKLTFADSKSNSWKLTFTESKSNCRNWHLQIQKVIVEIDFLQIQNIIVEMDFFRFKKSVWTNWSKTPESQFSVTFSAAVPRRPSTGSSAVGWEPRPSWLWWTQHPTQNPLSFRW